VQHRSTHRFVEKVRATFDAFSTWSDTPKGRLARWATGIVLTVVSIGAGHPWR
jgi:hypothetical protein